MRPPSALRAIPLLAGCTHDELARIDRLGVAVEVAPGRALTREGASARECFVTLDGSASVLRAAAAHRHRRGRLDRR